MLAGRVAGLVKNRTLTNAKSFVSKFKGAFASLNFAPALA